MDDDTGADLGCGGCADSIARPRRLDAQGQLSVYLLSLKALGETGCFAKQPQETILSIPSALSGDCSANHRAGNVWLPRFNQASNRRESIVAVL
jgi:hypothetical protein